MKVKLFSKTVALLLLLSLPMFSVANTQQPSEVVLDRINALVDRLDADRAEYTQDKTAFLNMVDEVISPVFDFFYISKLVMGASWKKATKVQQQEFARQFKKLLLVTYGTALLKYRGDGEIEFTNTKLKKRKNIDFSQVDSAITFSSNNKVDVVYYMLNTGTGWKIYNLHIAGLDMVLHYRELLTPVFFEQGIEGAIAYMRDYNEKNY